MYYLECPSLPTVMFRKRIRDIRNPFVWYLVCLCLTTVYIVSVTSHFYVHINSKPREYSHIEMEEGRS